MNRLGSAFIKTDCKIVSRGMHYVQAVSGISLIKRIN